MGKFVDLTGQKFGRLTVIERAEDKITKRGTPLIMYKCKCDCGNECTVLGANLKHGKTSSCGCYAREVSSKTFKYSGTPNKYRSREGYGICIASNTKEEILFDLDDFPLIKKYRWSVATPNKRGYKTVVGKVDGKLWSMARYLMKDKGIEGMCVDHINRNSLDNRRSNLRVCTIQDNTCNMKPKNRLGVKGVCFIKRNKFEAKIKRDDKIYHLGIFNTMKEATDTYDKKAAELFGEYALFNNYKGVRAVSLFDGIGSGMIALQKVYGAVEKYYAFESNDRAIQTAMINYPKIIQCGSPNSASFRGFEDIDYLFMRNPSTDFNIGGEGGIAHSLFLIARTEIKPRFFIYEINRSIAENVRNMISEQLGFEPTMINSSLVTALNKKRYYWVGIRNNDGSYKSVEVIQPRDKKIKMSNIVDGVVDREKARGISFVTGWISAFDYFKKRHGNLVFEPTEETETAYSRANGERYPVSRVCNGELICNDRNIPIKIADGNYIVRNLTVDECKRLEGIPKDFIIVGDDLKTMRLFGNVSTIDVLQILIFSILRVQ